MLPLESELSVVNNMKSPLKTLRKHFLSVTYADIFCIGDVGGGMACCVPAARSLSHSEELFICSFSHSLEFLEGWKGGTSCLVAGVHRKEGSSPR